MKILVSKLLQEPGAEVHRTFRPKAEDLAYEGIAFAPKPIRVEANLQNADGSLLGLLQVECHVQVECSRCLEPYTFGISADRQIRYLTHPTEEELRSELKGWFVSAFDGESVIIDEDVRQILLLAVPTRPLCHEDCRGLCPKCGTNLNANACAHVNDRSNRSGAIRRDASPDNPFRAAFDQIRRRKD